MSLRGINYDVISLAKELRFRQLRPSHLQEECTPVAVRLDYLFNWNVGEVAA